MHECEFIKTFKHLPCNLTKCSGPLLPRCKISLPSWRACPTFPAARRDEKITRGLICCDKAQIFKLLLSHYYCYSYYYGVKHSENFKN